jgi:hypothetical protein
MSDEELLKMGLPKEFLSDFRKNGGEWWL